MKNKNEKSKNNLCKMIDTSVFFHFTIYYITIYGKSQFLGSFLQAQEQIEF